MVEENICCPKCNSTDLKYEISFSNLLKFNELLSFIPILNHRSKAKWVCNQCGYKWKVKKNKRF